MLKINRILSHPSQNNLTMTQELSSKTLKQLYTIHSPWNTHTQTHFHSCGAAHAVLLYASVSTHFTLHFHSAAFHIPPHQGAEGEEQSGMKGKMEKQTVCFSNYLSF